VIEMATQPKMYSFLLCPICSLQCIKKKKVAKE
jgi:hypothetical protein